ncbi:unnamed protein product, partial [Closterium sp. NIES-53]
SAFEFLPSSAPVSCSRNLLECSLKLPKTLSGSQSAFPTRSLDEMACVGAATACMDVDALFSSHWEQVRTFFHHLLSVDFKWTSSSNQVAAKSVLVVDEPPAVKDEVPAVPVVEVPAVPVEVSAVPVEVPAVPVEVIAIPVEVPAVLMEVSAIPVEVPAVPVEVPADLVETAACSAETAALSTELVPPFSAARSSAEAMFNSTESSIYSIEKAWWLAVLEPEEVVSSFLVAEPYQDATLGTKSLKGVMVGAEASSRRCSLNRNESACLIDLTWDTCSFSSDSLCSTQTNLFTEAASGKRGNDRGISSKVKGWNKEGKRFGKAEG